jgi:hypothetical protein
MAVPLQMTLQRPGLQTELAYNLLTHLVPSSILISSCNYREADCLSARKEVPRLLLNPCSDEPAT